MNNKFSYFFMIILISSMFTFFEIPNAHAAPTRLYFSDAATPSVSPSFDGWGETADAVQRQILSSVSAGESLNLGTRVNWTAGNTNLERQYVSAPMDSGISFIATTVKMQLACREFNNGDNSVPRISMKIVSQDGTTLRQQLLTIANYGTTTEYINNVSLRNKIFADGDVVSGVYVTAAGDRIVIEIGHADSAGSTPEAQCRFGAPTGTAEHGENDTETTALVPWVEFSNTITFQAANQNKAVSDSVTVSDSISKSANKVKTFSDNVIVSDSISVEKVGGGTTKELTDVIVVSDSISVQKSGGATIQLADSVTITDSTNKSIIITSTGNAIRLSLNFPASDRLGGVYAFTCPAGQWAYGINTDGTLLCSDPTP